MLTQQRQKIDLKEKVGPKLQYKSGRLYNILMEVKNGKTVEKEAKYQATDGNNIQQKSHEVKYTMRDILQ